jgi:dihydroorotase-like cyclic amidohydrolase
MSAWRLLKLYWKEGNFLAKYSEQFTFPGGVDIHTHLREPSPVNKAETFRTGSQAALLAGNIAIADISNTPGRETWTLGRVLEKNDIIRHTAVAPVGIWFGSQPESDNIREFGSVSNWVVGLKIFAHPTTGNIKHYEAEDFREILTRWHAANPDLPVALHSGEDNLEGFIELAEEIGFHLHNFHTNDPKDVELIQKAKDRGVEITCGVCPHHLLMIAGEVEDWSKRMQPPLVGLADSEKLMHQLINGQIDILETDHAPHPQTAKDAANQGNPDGIENPKLKLPRCYGIRSLRVALPLMLREFDVRGVPFDRFVEVTSTKPAEIIGVKISDYTSVTYNMEEYELIDDGPAPEGAAPSPFLGRLALGKVIRTRIGGVSVVEDGCIITGYHPRRLIRGALI